MLDALKRAVENGYLHIVNQLLLVDGVINDLSEDDIKELLAYADNYPDVFSRLIEIPSIFDYAENNSQDFIYNLSSFVMTEFELLDVKKKSFIPTIENPIFDIEEDDFQFYFIILRNSIRSNNRSLDANINQLLDLPTIRNRINLTSRDEESHQLLLLARNVNNIEAVLALLSNLEVGEAITENSKQTHTNTDDLNLREIVEDEESSIGALDPGQQKMFDGLKSYYKLKMQELGGTVSVFELFKNHLKDSYEKDPAILNINGDLIKLPLLWNDFIALNLSSIDHELALKEYYKNHLHTAFRYLSKPNHWLDKDAQFLKPNSFKLRYSYFEDYIDLIAYYWLAASDDLFPEYNDSTINNRIEFFIKSLALVGRAHNWDKTRLNLKDKQEEYDDQEGDKPSCFSGMIKRLYTAIPNHPLLSGLNIEIIKLDFNQFVLDHFRKRMAVKSNKERGDIIKAIQNVFEDLVEPAAILKSLNISHKVKEAWIKKLKAKYGEDFTSNPSYLAYISKQLELKKGEAHVLKFYLRCNLADILAIQPINYFFYLKSLTFIAQFTAVTALVVGIILSKPVIIGCGIAMMVSAAILPVYSLFSGDRNNSDSPDIITSPSLA